MILRFLRAALRSPAVHSASVLAAGGVGFALGILLLARVLPASEFGMVSLLLATIHVGGALGVAGIPILIVRHRLGASGGFLLRCAAGGLVAGLIVAVALFAFYGMSLALAGTAAGLIALAALTRVAAAFFQARRRFGVSLLLMQIHNWLVLVSVPIVLYSGQPVAMTVALVAGCGYLATTVFGWWSALKWPREAVPRMPRRQWLHEGLSAAGIMLAANLLLQLDRLLIGAALTLQDLAAYAVVASVAGSPYRMLQTGAGFALTPRLRTCTTRDAALRLLRHESVLLIGIGVFAAIAILPAMPWLIDHFLDGRYTPPGSLTAIIIVTGFVRICGALAAAVVNALGSSRQLLMLNVVGWFTVAVSTAGALWGSRYGLVGMSVGLGVGWLVSAVGAGALAARALRRFTPPR